MMIEDLLPAIGILSVGLLGVGAYLKYQQAKRRLWLEERRLDREEREAIRRYYQIESERMLREYEGRP